jgi:hypothetical protein
VRIGGPVSLIAEARAFAFKKYDLLLDLEGDPPLGLVDSLIDELPAARFNPFVYNVVGGIVLSFD